MRVFMVLVSLSVLLLGCKENTPMPQPTAPKAQPAAAKTPTSSNVPLVEITTSMGKIRVELDEAKAPITVKNFLRYVDEGFYDGTIFHRVINGFMIQGGGFTESMQQKSTHEPIKNEATNGLKNVLGTLAMARTSVVDSATAQFFINVADNAFLDNRGTDAQSYGYAVFGKVTQGLDVVDKIKAVPVSNRGPIENVPTQAVVILSVKRVTEL